MTETREPKYRYKPSTIPEDNLWYGTRGHHDADIMIVGESWGLEERRMKLPFMGKSGQLLEILLREAGIPYSNCFFTNVVSAQPRGNNMATLFYQTKQAELEGKLGFHGLYPKPEVMTNISKLGHQIEQVNPKLIIGLGNYTLWALTEDSFEVKPEEGRLVPTGIGNYRGSQLYTTLNKIPFLPTYHPAATFRTYAWRAMIRHDLKVRVPKALEGKWAEPNQRVHYST